MTETHQITIVLDFGFASFGFVSDFEFRISDLETPPDRRALLKEELGP
jgi:hypothetical protein